MKLLMIFTCLYVIAGMYVATNILPRMDSKYHTLFFTIVSIILGPIFVTQGYIEGIIKIIRGGGDSNDQT